MAKLGTIYVELSLDDKIYKQKLSEIQPNAVATAKGVETAWRALGTKSSAAFDAQRRAAENAYTLIKKSATSTANDIVRAEQAKNAKLKALHDQQYGAHVSMTEKLKKNWAEVGIAIAAAYSAIHIGKQLIDASLQMERINISMQAVANNSTLAGREIAFLKEESQRLGLVFADATQEYIKFSAAAKNTSIEGEKTRQIFTGMSEAITALKLSTQDASLIYMAMTQMVSKGKVSMEELRRQMGERLPGAIRLAAEGMGVSTAELIKNVEAGKVMAYDLLPALADQLHKTYGKAAVEAAQSGQAQINRFNNALFETKAALGDALMPVFTDVLSFLKDALPYVQAFVGGIKMMGAELAGFIDKMTLAMNQFGNPISYGANALFNTEKYQNYKVLTAQIDKNIDATKYDVYSQMNPGVSSQKSMLEMTDEQRRTAAARAREVIPAVVKPAGGGSKVRKTRSTVSDEAKELAKYEKEMDKLRDQYFKLVDDEVDYGMTENERAANAIIHKEEEKIQKLAELWAADAITDKEFYDMEERVHANAKAAMLDKETEHASKVANINFNLVSDIQGMQEWAHKLRLQQIDTEAAKLIKDGADQRAVAAWVADQQMQAWVMLARSSDSVTSGIKAAWYDLYQCQMTWGQVAYETTMDWYEQIGEAFGDTLYDGLINDFENLSDIWEDTWKSMLKTMTRYLGKMAMEAMTEKIVLMFKSEWVEGGSSVLGIVNSVLGFAGSFFGGGSNYGQSTGAGDWTGGLGFASGGRVPGSPSSVDSVAAMLAPGEHVIPSSLVQQVAAQGQRGDSMLAHINPAEAAVLRMLGGSGTINPRTGLPQFYYDTSGDWIADPESTINLDQQWSDYLNTLPPRLRSFMSGRYYSGMGDSALAMLRATRFWQMDDGTIGAFMGGADIESNKSYFKIFPDGSYNWLPVEGIDTPSTFMSEYGGLITAGLSAINPYLGMIGSLAVGAATVANDDGVNWSDVLPGMAMGVAGNAFSLLGGYKGLMDLFKGSSTSATLAHEGAVAENVGAMIAESMEQYPSSFAGSIYESSFWSDLASSGLDWAGNSGMRMAMKYAINSLLGGGEGGSNGHLKISYMGADDNGLLASLAKQMQGLNGEFAFSARDGLDYVPRDNFLVNAHKGEAVITASENRERQQGSNRPITVKVFIGNEEFKGTMRAEADGVIVARNQRNIASTARIY